MGPGIVGAVGDFLPVAMALALSPFPIVAMVVLLGSPRGVEVGVAFAVGWVGGLGALTAILALAAGGLEEAAVGLGAGMQMLLGAGLVWAAWRKWRTRPLRGQSAVLPGWAASLGSAGPLRAAGIGAMLGGANPKSVALAYAAAASVAVRNLGLLSSAVALAIFVLLASASVFGTLALKVTGGAAGEAQLEAGKRFLLRNNNVILMVVFLLAGMKVIGNGLGQLGG